MSVCLLVDVVGYIFPRWLGTFITCTMHVILPYRYVRDHFGSRVRWPVALTFSVCHFGLAVSVGPAALVWLACRLGPNCSWVWPVALAFLLATLVHWFAAFALLVCCFGHLLTHRSHP